MHAPALVQLSLLAEIPNDSLTLNAGFWPDSGPVYDEPDLVRDRETARGLAGLLGSNVVCFAPLARRDDRCAERAPGRRAIDPRGGERASAPRGDGRGPADRAHAR
jgi:hypothetical protein